MDRTTSLYLDIVRPAAALIVLLSHVGNQLSLLAPAGVQAVDVFFVLSGFVIAHVTESREREPDEYFISRAARIYSVAIPALLLTAIPDSIGFRANAAAYAGPFQPLTPGILIRSVLFINEQWTTHRFPGSNSPYWSLGFEVWYYIVFGLWIFTPHRWRWVTTIAALAFIGPKVALLFPLWLMGVGLYRIYNKPLKMRPLTGWVLFVVPLFLIVLYQLLPHPPMQPFVNIMRDVSRFVSLGQDYLVGLLFSVHLIGFAVISGVFASPLDNARSIDPLGSSTYYDLLDRDLTLARLLTLDGSTPDYNDSFRCFAFAEISERQKDAWRRVITESMLTSRCICKYLRKS
jgi:peptidoglycan/LPS O-acetylase OafA/YrhL